MMWLQILVGGSAVVKDITGSSLMRNDTRIYIQVGTRALVGIVVGFRE